MSAPRYTTSPSSVQRQHCSKAIIFTCRSCCVPFAKRPIINGTTPAQYNLGAAVHHLTLLRISCRQRVVAAPGVRFLESAAAEGVSSSQSLHHGPVCNAALSTGICEQSFVNSCLLVVPLGLIN